MDMIFIQLNIKIYEDLRCDMIRFEGFHNFKNVGFHNFKNVERFGS